MEDNNFLGSNRKKLFALLLIIQAVVIGMMIGAGQFSNGLFTTIFAIVFLLAANFCLQPGFAILYCVFSFFCALYLIDPIGLFITGHGQKKTLVQNVLCLVAFVIILISAYVGYLFSKQLTLERANAYNQGSDYFQNENPSFTRPVNQPANRTNNNQSNNQPSTSYGGTNYLYQNPFATQPRQTTTRNQPARSNWQPFTGQAYSLA